jgi:hypothetical protein
MALIEVARKQATDAHEFLEECIKLSGKVPEAKAALGERNFQGKCSGQLGVLSDGITALLEGIAVHEHSKKHTTSGQLREVIAEVTEAAGAIRKIREGLKT